MAGHYQYMEKQHHFIQRSVRFIEQHALLEKGDRVLLSMSAGKDSMAMLHVMLQVKDEYALDMGIFHLNHGMRGEESDADEKLLRQLAAAHGIPFFCQKHDLMSSTVRGMSFEEHARDLRYSLIASVMDEHGYTRVCTAHNRDDQAETILMRVLGGTGIHGLAGMPFSRDRISRPLMWASADEVYMFLEDMGVQWREDGTNRENDYLRNFVRNRLLPLAEERFPSAKKSICSLGLIAGEHQQMTGHLIRKAYPGLVINVKDGVAIRYRDIISIRPLFMEVCAQQVRETFQRYVDRSMLEELYRTVREARGHVVLYEARGLRIMKTRHGGDEVLLISESGAGHSPHPWEYTLSFKAGANRQIPEAGISLEIRVLDLHQFTARVGRNDAVYLDPGDNDAELVVRNRRKGDKITLENGTKKIKDLLIDHKLSPEEKERVPIVLIGNKIACCMLSVVGSGDNRVAESFKVGDNSKKILAICASPTYR